MYWIIDALVVFLLSLCLAGFIIPQILLISFKKKLFDLPDERKIHQGAVPRLGGLAFLPSIIIALSFVAGVQLILLPPKEQSPEMIATLVAQGATLTDLVKPSVLPLCMGVCAMMIMYLVGIADDLVGVKYSAKFMAQIFVGVLLAAGGVNLTNLHGMFGLWQLPWPVAWGLTVFLVVFVINAINLIDGIDGLASGLSGIAAAFLGCALLLEEEYVYAMVAFAALGTLVPFFYYNVFGSAAVGKKIFMGDTGALTTGTVLVFLALELADIPSPTCFRSDLIVVAFAPLILPCMDVIRVFFHRIVRRRNPFLPDRVHIHHKLLGLGLSQSWALVCILATSVCIIASNVLMSPWVPAALILLVDILFWTCSNLLLTRALHARGATYE